MIQGWRERERIPVGTLETEMNAVESSVLADERN
jgi:hypothetical protein